MSYLDPSDEVQQAVWDAAVGLAAAHRQAAGDIAVSPGLDATAIRMKLVVLDPAIGMDPTAAMEWCAALMTDSLVHTTSPTYSGLFNPSPSF